eukprot:19264-Eustigmatos_ZCMA.PRE.1
MDTEARTAGGSDEASTVSYGVAIKLSAWTTYPYARVLIADELGVGLLGQPIHVAHLRRPGLALTHLSLGSPECSMARMA